MLESDDDVPRVTRADERPFEILGSRGLIDKRRGSVGTRVPWGVMIISDYQRKRKLE